MKYLFDVCLWNKGDPDHGPVLSLPATPYELLDVLEKVRTENSAPVHWKIIGVYSNQFNISISEEAGSVYELNAFARKLSELNDSQQIACCGLLKMEQEQTGHSLPLSRLIDIAYGTHCCQVIPELRSDTRLARYYVERNAVSEIRDLPAEQLSLLNYAAIGEKQRKTEGGVFVRGDSSKTSGYVRRSALIEETHLDLTLRKPEYSILLSVYGRWDPSTGRRRSTLLELPAREEVLNAVLTEYDGMGSSDDVWNRIAWEGLDCAVPMLTDMIFEYGSDTSYSESATRLLNDFAKSLAGMEPQDITAYKALLEAMNCRRFDTAAKLLDTLGDYSLSRQISTPADMAKETLLKAVRGQSAKTLIPYVNMERCGEVLVEKSGGELTSYGLLTRKDGQPVANFRDQPEQRGWQMGMMF